MEIKNQRLRKIILRGQPPSGKNQQQIAMVCGRVMKFPNSRFKAWRADVWTQLQTQRDDWRTLTVPVHIMVDYWPGDRRRRDVPGIEDAICHLLEWCPVHGKKKNKDCQLPIIADDSLLKNWSWITHDIDSINPRLEIIIEDIIQHGLRD